MNAAKMSMFQMQQGTAISNVVQSITAPPTVTSTSDPFTLLDRYMTFIIPDANSRILGQQNLHFNVLTVLAYWQSSGAQQHWGNYTITTIVDRTGRFIAPWYAFRVDNIQLGNGFPVSIYFWGETPGINTVVSRYRWWQLYFISSVRENIKNRFTGVTGQSFVPFPGNVGVLTERPLLRP